MSDHDDSILARKALDFLDSALADDPEWQNAREAMGRTESFTEYRVVSRPADDPEMPWGAPPRTGPYARNDAMLRSYVRRMRAETPEREWAIQSRTVTVHRPEWEIEDVD